MIQRRAKYKPRGTPNLANRLQRQKNVQKQCVYTKRGHNFKQPEGDIVYSEKMWETEKCLRMLRKPNVLLIQQHFSQTPEESRN